MRVEIEVFAGRGSNVHIRKETYENIAEVKYEEHGDFGIPFLNLCDIRGEKVVGFPRDWIKSYSVKVP